MTDMISRVLDPLEFEDVMRRQLPMASVGLVGRAAEIGRITGALTTDGPRLVLVTGAPGVGKSAVAVHSAHLLAESYPDGQLFADLHSHGGGPPTDEDETLARFLRALGVPAQELPRRRDEAVATFRTLTADRRLLIVLDDVADPGQVRPLLPGGTTCGVLVTSRHELAGLVAAPGARPVPLATLGDDAAGEVLGNIVGAERTAADPAATAELLAVCGGLPLALRVTAARLAVRPHLPVAAYVDELRADPLAALRTEPDGSGVASALAASDERLAPDARRLLRLLGIAPAGEITVAVAAILAGRTRPAATAGLEQLAEAGLLERRERGYQLHPLVRAFARERLVHDEPADESHRRSSVTELRESPSGATLRARP